MRWEDFRRSDNIDDRRDDASAGGRVGIPMGRGGLGIGTIVVLGLVGWALGIDPRLLIGGAEILSGGDGGTLAGAVDVSLRVSASRLSARIQETHILIGHVLCDLVDRQLAGEPG